MKSNKNFVFICRITIFYNFSSYKIAINLFFFMIKLNLSAYKNKLLNA